MKMVAAAKLRRAQAQLIAARPYSKKIGELMMHLAANADLNEHPLVKERTKVGSEPAKVALLIVTADRGFCGAFNSNIIKATNTVLNSRYEKQFEAGEVKLFIVGKKGYDFFSKRNYNVVGNYSGVFHDLQFGVAKRIASEIIKGYLNADYDRVEIIYNEFKNIIQQRLLVEQFLPIPREVFNTEERRRELQYIYEPDQYSILESLVPQHLEYQIWRVLLESNAASEGARMAAMDNATENASELMEALTLQYNKARQASITKELLEVVSGAEALTAES
jgi:F-type H+-transporting ATPase subunit gamma